MSARRSDEPGRVASSLELFFDLVFVIAVSVLGSQLHHALSQGDVAGGVLHYAMIFFAIWWAWMGFTWFGTSFATDDWLYRALTIVQMGGVMVVAAGISEAFNDDDFTLIVAGYVIMRIPMCLQWWRASVSAPEYRRTAATYAVGIGVVQVLWVGFLALPSALVFPGFVVLMLMEIAVPVVAERRLTTPWHAHHITERYGAFTLIVLGEGLLASTNAIVHALEGHDHVAELILIGVLVLLVTACSWWIYFWPPHHDAIGTLGDSLRYGYLHYVVFAAAAAFSAGVEVEIDRIVGAESLGEVGASFAVTVPIALFLLATWAVAIQGRSRVVDLAILGGALLVLADPVVPLPLVWTAAVMVGIVVVLVRVPAESHHP
jgi:low temperature requirement protein LtrA